MGTSMKTPLSVMPPMPPMDGQFGAVRKFDIHTGIDLHTSVGTKVYAMESGIVVAVLDFTGPDADSPWWNATKAVMVESESGVILYGEIEPKVNVGDYVFAGDLIGTILQVLKTDKGKPLAMLHLELYTHGTREPVWWKLNEPKPANLLDPTPLLEKFHVQDAPG